jgi:hypothetical protein
MTDNLGVPPERELTDEVRARARSRIVAGMREREHRRAARAFVPISIAAGVVVLVGAVAGVVAVNHKQPVPSAAVPAVTSADVTPAPTSTGTAPSARALQFPLRQLRVSLTGYDDTVHMVTFVLVTWVPGGPDDGHYTPSPVNPGPHRLALAANPTITALSTVCSHGTSTTNPIIDGAPCTPAEFVQTLHAGPDKIADVHVDATDHIDVVRELYHP